MIRGYRRAEVDAFLDRCAGIVDLPPGRAVPSLPPPTAQEVRLVQFGREFRGYAMPAVDDLLDKVAAALN
jgi:DivIVA domain-containing protein